MRSHPADYELIAPGKLEAVLALLAREPGVWLPIAGGTEVMVQYGAGRLAARKLVSLWGLPELRRIERTADALVIGAGCTYSDLRNHPGVAQEFPLLARAASWTGSIANQNRGTLGGNIVNGSPAADSLPALLVYDAELLLLSERGERRVPYAGFHTGYKKNGLAADEIIAAIALKSQFGGYDAYARKVGTRNAQAISKLCLAALGKVKDDKIEDVRLALGSMAVTPIRLHRTEEVLRGKSWAPKLIKEARQALASEVAPIDDIRSTAAYRLRVAGNLLQEFLEGLFGSRAAAGTERVL
jgi:CO/xanthine dehydrogenase FAD-binding subunit